MPVNHPHNNIFEKVMELPQAAEALINHFFPADIKAELDLSTLKQEHDSFITEDLAPFFSDIIYSCLRLGKKSYISFLFEHKSYYEMPDLQLLTYTTLGYKKQELNYKADNKNNKNKEPFKPTLILPVLLYHGTEPWQNKTFSDLFELENELFKPYIPSIKYLLINLQQHPDDELETIQMKILLSMLLLFKHKNDKEYVLKNFRKIFIFVEEDEEGTISKVFIKIFVLYIYSSFNFEAEEVKSILPELPTPVKNEIMTFADTLIAGGIQKGEIKSKLETLTELFLKFPELSDDLYAELTKLPKATVIKLKIAFNGEDKQVAIQLGRKLFEAVPNLSEQRFNEIDKFMTKLWNRVKGKELN